MVLSVVIVNRPHRSIFIDVRILPHNAGTLLVGNPTDYGEVASLIVIAVEIRVLIGSVTMRNIRENHHLVVIRKTKAMRAVTEITGKTIQVTHRIVVSTRCVVLN